MDFLWATGNTVACIAFWNMTEKRNCKVLMVLDSGYDEY